MNTALTRLPKGILFTPLSTFAPSAWLFLSILSLCFEKQALVAQLIESDRGALEHLVGSYQSASGVPGLAVGLVDANEVVIAVSGVRAAAPAPSSPLSETDVFNIGSNFKAITATIAARAVEKGQLQWDSTLGQVFPEYAATGNPQMLAVTLKQLLAHRGGAGGDTRILELLNDLTGSAEEIRAKAVPIVLNAGPDTPIDSYSYSNIGYGLAGAMLERVSGKTFDFLVESELRVGLNMPSLMRGSPGGTDLLHINAPLGHDEEGMPVTPAEESLPEGLEPAGLYSVNMEDWAKLIRVHLQTPEYANYLSADSLAELHTGVGGPIGPGPEGDIHYGLGWVTLNLDGESYLYHNGSNGYWYSAALLNPSNDRAILLASNQESSGVTAIEGLISDAKVRAWMSGSALVPEPATGIFAAALLAIALLAKRGKFRSAARGGDPHAISSGL